MSTPRSNRVEVRNPVLALPSTAALLALPLESRHALAAVLSDLGRDAATRAESNWRNHKAPMAAYWKAIGVYSRHLSRTVKKGNSDHAQK